MSGGRRKGGKKERREGGRDEGKEKRREGGREEGMGAYPSCAEFLNNVDSAFCAEDVEELDDVHVVEGLRGEREGGKEGGKEGGREGGGSQ